MSEEEKAKKVDVIYHVVNKEAKHGCVLVEL